MPLCYRGSIKILKTTIHTYSFFFNLKNNINVFFLFSSLSRLQDKLQANNLNDNQNNSNKTKSPQTDNNTKGRERKVLSRLPPGATAAGVFPSPPPRGVLVIRTPRGPDGTKGFQKR